MMSSHHSNWHICLFSLALTFVAAKPTAAFSNRSKRPSRKRVSAHFATTRRIFCFVPDGSLHTIFSSIRKYSASSSPTKKQSSQSSSTSINYRTAVEDDDRGYGDEGESNSYTDTIWQGTLSISSKSETMARLRDGTESEKISNPDPKKNEFFETAKAFIPVAVEIGVVASMAANIHLN